MANFDASNFIRGALAGAAAMKAAALKAADTFGENVIGNAQELAPVLTGALQESGTTDPATEDGSNISKTIGFNTEYAAAVHENLDAHHDVGQAKFLESALREAAPKFGPYVAGKIKESTGA